MWNTLGSRFITGTAPGRDLPLWNGTGTPQPLELRFITGTGPGRDLPLWNGTETPQPLESRFITVEHPWVAFYHCGTPSGCFLQWQWH